MNLANKCVYSLYHCKENAKLLVHVYNISICEYKLRFLVLFALQDNVDLLGCHGEHGQLNAIELIETAPCTRLG